MAGDEQLIHCRVAAVPGGHRVTVTGEVDMQTAPRLTEALLQFANGSVTVDLTNVTFLDSSGLYALECAHQQIRHRNARLVVDAVSAHVRRVLEIAGLATLPPFELSVERPCTDPNTRDRSANAITHAVNDTRESRDAAAQR